LIEGCCSIKHSTYIIPILLFSGSLSAFLFHNIWLKWLTLISSFVYLGLIKASMLSIIPISNFLLKTFPKYFKTLDEARAYEKKPEKIANRVYSNRMGNGDESTGDGFRYLGRGLIQLTGKNNYTLFAAAIDTPLEQIPEYLQTFEGAVQSACWFWEQNNLNQWADKKDIMTLTKRINGGTIGLEDRIKHYNHALHLFVGH
jgi:predicted chitinase